MRVGKLTECCSVLVIVYFEQISLLQEYKPMDQNMWKQTASSVCVPRYVLFVAAVVFTTAGSVVSLNVFLYVYCLIVCLFACLFLCLSRSVFILTDRV